MLLHHVREGAAQVDLQLLTDVCQVGLLCLGARVAQGAKTNGPSVYCQLVSLNGRERLEHLHGIRPLVVDLRRDAVRCGFNAGFQVLDVGHEVAYIKFGAN